MQEVIFTCSRCGIIKRVAPTKEPMRPGTLPYGWSRLSAAVLCAQCTDARAAEWNAFVTSMRHPRKPADTLSMRLLRLVLSDKEWLSQAYRIWEQSADPCVFGARFGVELSIGTAQYVAEADPRLRVMLTDYLFLVDWAWIGEALDAEFARAKAETADPLAAMLERVQKSIC